MRPRTEWKPPSRIRKCRRISERQNHRCAYCGVRTWSKALGEKGLLETQATIDHLVCRSQGGTWQEDNLVMACHQCNNERQNQYEAYVFWLMKSEELSFADAFIHLTDIVLKGLENE